MTPFSLLPARILREDTRHSGTRLSHMQDFRDMISRPPGLYVDRHSINEHLTRTVLATGSLRAQS